jgi:hypothetical protein
VLITVPSISLVDQTILEFEREGIRDIGVMQANHERTYAMARVQLATLQTLQGRTLPDVDFIINDEAHIQHKFFNDLLDGAWSDKLAIGLTATPWAKGMGLRWSKLIIPATIPQLIDEGFLTPTRLYLPEEVADRDNIDSRKGEFTGESASSEMSQSRIIGNVVETWKQYGPGEKTFLFCVKRSHAQQQMNAFRDYGIPFGYIDALTSRDDRKLLFEQMHYGEIAGIASVGCLIAGVDADVRCLIDTDPTKSEIRHVQKWGRGIRTADGKGFLLGFDHAGNNSENGLGLFWEIYHDHLDTSTAKEKGPAYKGKHCPAKPRLCPQCRMLIPRGRVVCFCGATLPVISDVMHEDGDLVLYGTKGTGASKTRTMDEKQEFYSGLLYLAEKHGKSPGLAAYRYRDKFGVWPDQLKKVPLPPSKEVIDYDKYQRIRYAKSMEKKTVPSRSEAKQQ